MNAIVVPDDTACVAVTGIVHSHVMLTARLAAAWACCRHVDSLHAALHALWSRGKIFVTRFSPSLSLGHTDLLDYPSLLL